jgi:hypothetical protein
MSSLLFRVEAVRCFRSEDRNDAVRFLPCGFQESATTADRVQTGVAKPEMTGRIR